MADLADLPPPEGGGSEGYYPDPLGGKRTRWWDGDQWTTQMGAKIPQTSSKQAARPPAVATKQKGEAGDSGAPPGFMDRVREAPNWLKIVVPIVVLLIVVGALTPSDEDESSDSTPAADVTEETPTVTVQVRPQDGTVVRENSVILRGTVTPADSVVKVNFKPVELNRNGSFSYEFELGDRVGLHGVIVAASHQGFEPAREVLSFERALSQAELAAIEAEREADFKAQATTIDYDELIKDPTDYIGTKVVYEGQIFQIQEVGSKSIILLAVTNEGYGFWDDNIWVDAGEIASAEDDVITVYGTVTGSKTYQTQIGGSTFVPRVKAEYIEE